MASSAPTFYKGAKVWYYNAVLTIPNSGDVNEQVGRFYDPRTVPLIEDTGDFIVALRNLNVTGSAANLPILVPPLRSLTASGAEPYINTGYAIGVRYLALNPSYPTSYAYSDMQVSALRVPSAYPTSDRQTTTSKFYWITSQADVMVAINTTLNDVFTVDSSRQPKFTNVGPASICQTVTASVPFGWQPCGDASFPNTPIVCSLAESTESPTSAKRMVMSGANFIADLGGGVSIDPLNAEWTAGTTIYAYVYFNDKLLEAVPWDTLFDYFPTSTSPVWAEQLPAAVFNSGPITTLGFTDMGSVYPMAFTRPHGQMMSTQVRAPRWIQENSATSNWGYYTGVAITSGMLPAYPTTTGVNEVITKGAASVANTASAPILFECAIPSPSEGLYALQNGFTETPSVLQWQTMKPGVRLGAVDLQLYLKTRYGNYEPWSITNGGSITVGLVFSQMAF